MKVEISNGELLDKISILDIKLSKIADPDKRRNVLVEANFLIDSALADCTLREQIDSDNYKQLLEVNNALWIIEDKIREKERLREFDDEFVELARSVYLLNDQRAAIKKRINENTGSLLIEEKQYAEYQEKVEESDSSGNTDSSE